MRKYFIISWIFFTSIIYTQEYMLESVITNLTSAVSFTFLPNNNVIINHKAGLVKIYTLNNVFVSNFWNFTDSTLSTNEAGLIGVCLDPNYAVNRFIYFYYTHLPNRYRVVRLTENNNVGTNPLIIFDASPIIGGVHFAGNMRFGKDNKLYVSIGNNSPSSINSQDLNTFKGKILRINSDGSIPADNPFYDDGNPLTGNDDRIWAYGLRNSFDLTVSPINDSIYATENMGGSPDEINFIRKGKNYGYPHCIGNCFPYNPLYKNPITELPGNDFQNYAPTGILVYNGSQMPELVGKLLTVGAGGGQIFRGLLKCELGNAPFYDTITSKNIMMNITGYSTIAQGSDGYVYIMRLNSVAGSISRLKYDLTGVGGNNTAVQFSLSQNYPNPFNPTTSIKYEVSKQSDVSLKVYNVLGIEIASLVNETKLQGSYEVSWDASAYPSGVYFYELQAGEYKERRKMVLIK